MPKLIKCKACGHEVAKNAKVCPNCGKRQHLPFLGRLAIVIAVIAIIGGAIGASGNSSSTPKGTYKVGQTFKSDDYEITVMNVEKRLSDTSADARLIAVTYKIKNITESPINAPSIDISLVSPTGTNYDADMAQTISYSMEVEANEKVLSDLNPGLSTKGAIVFEVAEEKLAVQGWKLEVEGNEILLSL